MSKLYWRKWQDGDDWTWDELGNHLWEEFRFALYETETEVDVSGIGVEFGRAFNSVAAKKDVQGVRVEYGSVLSSTEAQAVVNIIVSDRDYLSAMLEYLPPFERNTSVFNELLTAYDRQFRQMEQGIKAVERNTNIDTTIETLNLHERDLGIDNKKLDLAYDQRREQIIARYRAVYGQTTKDTIKNIASAFANGEVEITQADTKGIFDIRFIGLGVPDNLVGLSKALDIVFPAHLGYKFTFTYNTWSELADTTWGNAINKTWEDIREWEDVS